MNFLRTVSVFYRNPFVNPHWAILKHVAWQFRKITNKFPYELNFNGFKVIIRNKVIANGCGSLLNAMGYYDPNNMYLVEELFKKQICKIFFDIGANIGIFSLIAGYQSDVEIFAFEPHPFTFDLLRENINSNNLENRIRSFPLAFSDYDGQAFFTNNPGSSTNKIEDSNGSNLDIKVDVITGDSFCLRHGIIPDVIKIDVEGHENLVLRGFKNVIENVQVIIVECTRMDETIDILLTQYGFLGPYKLDYRKRTFSKDFTSYEDWIFLNPDFIGLLKKYRFSIIQ